MPMPTVDIAGHKVLVNIVNHDSGDEPESACTNTLVGAKIGEVTYQYLNIDPLAAIRKIAEAVGCDVQFKGTPLPKMLTVVIARFHVGTTIDWKAAVSGLAILEAAVHLQ